MKKLTIVLVFLLVFCFSTVMAESFFPSASTVFGEAMPALSFAIHREPDNQESKDGSTVQIFNDLTDEEYYKFSKYLGESGCRIDKAEVANQVLYLAVAKNEAIMEIVFDYETRIISITYPEGTRIEATRSTKIVDGEDIFPSIEEAFGVGLPSMQTITSRPLNAERFEDGRTRLLYENITEDEYEVFNRYLEFYGCTYENIVTGNGSISALVMKGNTGFEFSYSIDSKVVELVYPRLSFINDIEYNDDSSLSGLLPIGEEAFGVDIPRIALVCALQSDGLVKLSSGEYQETYKHFTQEQYEKYSAWLLETGCTLKDYSVSDGVMTINLERNGEKFVLEYAHEKDMVTVRYAAGAHIAPTPTPVVSEVKETPKPETTIELYSQDTCWYTAENYFMNLRWKNPKSVVIHSHSGSFTGAKEGNPEYLFTIDYSAENGFGGTNRKTALIWVDAQYNRVTNAWIE